MRRRRHVHALRRRRQHWIAIADDFEKSHLVVIFREHVVFRRELLTRSTPRKRKLHHIQRLLRCVQYLITRETNKFLKKITENLENFSYNKIIANLHEIYGLLIKQIKKKYKKATLIENYEKILIAIMPVIPHFSSECLSLMGSKRINWPAYDASMLKEEKINIVVQVNGKKRDVINTKPGLSEEDLFELINKSETLNKYLYKQKIKRKIYIKDKLINIII